MPSEERPLPAVGAAEVQELFVASGLTLAVAESCTGGLLAARLTDIPGSSAYFLGGVVAYSDHTKVTVLGVPEELIHKYGAVSREVAQAMALSVQDLLGADIGVAITGIAGPGGATAAKPVGLTYIAVVGAKGVSVEEFRWTGTRAENRQRSVEAALAMLYRAGERDRRT